MTIMAFSGPIAKINAEDNYCPNYEIMKTYNTDYGDFTVKRFYDNTIEVEQINTERFMKHVFYGIPILLNQDLIDRFSNKTNIKISDFIDDPLYNSLANENNKILTLQK